MGEININYLAVLVCGASSMVIGFFWYGPLFGKAWMEEVGKTKEDLEENFSPVKTYSLSFISAVITALTLAYFLNLTGAQTIMESLRVSIAAWLGFVAAIFYLNSLFEERTVRYVTIHTGYHLVNMVVYGIILVSW